MDLCVREDCHGILRDGPVYFAFLFDGKTCERHQLRHLDGESLIFRVFVNISVLLVQSVDLEEALVAFGPRICEAFDLEFDFLSFWSASLAETAFSAAYVDEGSTFFSSARNALETLISAVFDQIAVVFQHNFVGNTYTKGEILGQEDAEESSNRHLMGHLEVESVLLIG